MDRGDPIDKAAAMLVDIDALSRSRFGVAYPNGATVKLRALPPGRLLALGQRVALLAFHDVFQHIIAIARNPENPLEQLIAKCGSHRLITLSKN
jgi:hypothetical protein